MTERMIAVIRVLHARTPQRMTPNEIGWALGFKHGHTDRAGNTAAHGCSHNGRVMGPAQRVIFALTALRKRSLVSMVGRRDGLSGTAYVLTDEGVKWCKENPQ